MEGGSSHARRHHRRNGLRRPQAGRAAVARRRGRGARAAGARSISEIVLFDRPSPIRRSRSRPARLKIVTGDITDEAQVEALITPETGSIWHFAAVVSAGAEADLDLGYAVNLDGTRHVLNACRKLPRRRA